MTTRDEVLAMAREAGIKYRHTPVGTNEMWCYDDAILRFAALVAAAEREECAKVCETKAEYWQSLNKKIISPVACAAADCADEIRERSAK